ACLSKEVAFAPPLVLLAWDALEPRTVAVGGADGGRPAARGATGWIRRNLGFVAAWAAALAIAVALRAAGVGTSLGPRAELVSRMGAVGGAAVGVGAWWPSLRLLAVPWPLQAWSPPSQVLPAWTAALGAAVTVAIVVAAAPGRACLPSL